MQVKFSCDTIIAMDKLQPAKPGRPPKHQGEKRAVKTVSIRPLTVELLADLGTRLIEGRKLSFGEVIDLLAEDKARKIHKKNSV